MGMVAAQAEATTGVKVTVVGPVAITGAKIMHAVQAAAPTGIKMKKAQADQINKSVQGTNQAPAHKILQGVQAVVDATVAEVRVVAATTAADKAHAHMARPRAQAKGAQEGSPAQESSIPKMQRREPAALLRAPCFSTSPSHQNETSLYSYFRHKWQKKFNMSLVRISRATRHGQKRIDIICLRLRQTAYKSTDGISSTDPTPPSHNPPPFV
jgi:hypothetical protein